MKRKKKADKKRDKTKKICASRTTQWRIASFEETRKPHGILRSTCHLRVLGNTQNWGPCRQEDRENTNIESKKQGLVISPKSQLERRYKKLSRASDV